MTDTQKKELEEILANYDAENLSDDDAKALVQEIKDLGIKPGQGLGEVLENAGIDARGLAQQAGISGQVGPGGPPPGGPPPGGRPGGVESAKGADSADVQTLKSIVEQLQESLSDSDSEEDFSTMLLEMLEEAGVDTSSPIVDIRA